MLWFIVLYTLGFVGTLIWCLTRLDWRLEPIDYATVAIVAFVILAFVWPGMWIAYWFGRMSEKSL